MVGIQLTVPRMNDGIYDEKLFKRPKGCSLNKPEKGGLWSSTFNKKFGSYWIDWCNYECPDLLPNNGTLLIPNKDVRVFTVDKLQDLENLLKSFTYTPSYKCDSIFFEYAYLDFEAMSKYLDAIHLTDNGQVKTRLSKPSLYGWDSECVLWLNTTFTVKKNIKIKKYLKNYREFILMRDLVK